MRWTIDIIIVSSRPVDLQMRRERAVFRRWWSLVISVIVAFRLFVPMAAGRNVGIRFRRVDAIGLPRNIRTASQAKLELYKPYNLLFGSLPSSNPKARPCASTSPISACFAMWWRPAASPTAPSAPIWRWPPPATRIRNMEQALGAPLLMRARHGVTPTQAGRTLLQHARTILAQAERLREDLGAYAGGLAGQVRVLSNTNALTEFLPEALSCLPGRPSQCQRRSRGAAHRRDRRPDRRRRRRYRHRRRHRRCRRLDDLSVPQRPLRAGGGATTIRWPSSAKISFAEVLDHDFVGLDRASAIQRFLAARRAASAARCGCACSCAASTRCAGWSSAMSASASCRRPRRARARKHGDQRGATDRSLGAARLTICMRDLAALPPYARQLVEHMRRSRDTRTVSAASAPSNPDRGSRPGSYSSPCLERKIAARPDPWWRRCAAAARRHRCGPAVRPSPAPPTRQTPCRPANSGATWRPPLIAATWNALARPLNDSARASEMTWPP